MKEKNTFHNFKSNYCCLDLVRAVEAEIFTEVVSGILYYDKKHEGCGQEVRIKFCPFCGAKIEVIKLEKGWNWKTTPITPPKQ